MRTKTASKELKRFDSRHRLTLKAKGIARSRGFSTYWARFDFGRKLSYYAGILTALRKHIKNLKGTKGLHLASSFGIFTKFLQERGVKSVAFDIGEVATQIAKQVGNKRVVRGDAMGANLLPFKQNSFDFFVSDQFLLSLPKFDRSILNKVVDSVVLLRLNLILKPNGIGIIKYAMNPMKDVFIHNLQLNARKESLDEYLGHIGFEVLEVNKRSNIIVLRKKRNLIKALNLASESL